ncbi:cupin domain-containing protein [Thauera butanivorans]|uniref:cupin domain-containing protein n=1 Tax=Thauera butanivorans TaxID=86174 RepID=UPI000B31CD68|nr:cupin domain-containing protein [Thauera butanivorans]
MMNFNRVVTGHDSSGHAELKNFDLPPGSGAFDHTPGFSVARIWHTSNEPVIESVPRDDVSVLPSVLPGCGGTTALVVTFPPDEQVAGHDFDPQKANAEFGEKLPGLAETFEPDGSGYHTTDTIDYGVVLEGEIVLDLGNGCERQLHRGDVVVQVGTRHAWRNRSGQPARMFFVLIGARRSVREQP